MKRDKQGLRKGGPDNAFVESNLSFHIACEKIVYVHSEFLVQNNILDIRYFF